MTTTKSLPLDERIPLEVWQRIFDGLYPSQLSRLSMVNKNFNAIVSSLSVWSHIFKKAHSADNNSQGDDMVRLRTLGTMSESKSYMLYMCAVSIYVCESCFGMPPIRRYGSGCIRPARAMAPMPTMNKPGLLYEGEELNVNWEINMCQSCRAATPDDWTRGLDYKSRDRVHWYRTQP